MKQKSLTVISLLALSLTLLAGCDSKPPRPQAVVISISKISEVTGIKEKIRISTETMNQQITAEIKALSEKLSKEIEDKKSSLGDTPSKEDKQKIRELRGQLSKQLFQARKEAYARRTKEKGDIRKSNFDVIRSVAKKVAMAHGASIILNANGTHWFEESVDITDEVIERMQGDIVSQSADNEKEERIQTP